VVAEELHRPDVTVHEHELGADRVGDPAGLIGRLGHVSLPGVLSAVLVAHLRPAAGRHPPDLVVAALDLIREDRVGTVGERRDVRAGAVRQHDDVRHAQLRPRQQRRDVRQRLDDGELAGQRLGQMTAVADSASAREQDLGRRLGARVPAHRFSSASSVASSAPSAARTSRTLRHRDSSCCVSVPDGGVGVDVDRDVRAACVVERGEVSGLHGAPPSVGSGTGQERLPRPPGRMPGRDTERHPGGTPRWSTLVCVTSSSSSGP
jgi:hypothetical protein